MRRRANKRSVHLLCAIVFRWIQVGLAWVAVLSLLFFLTTQCRVHRIGLPSNTLVWNIWLHHFQQIRAERERERETPWGPPISLLLPAPWLFQSFPTQIVMPYLGEGREGKRGHVTGEFGVVTEKNSPNFLLHHKRMNQNMEGGLIKSSRTLQPDTAQEGA